jgi:hypothetical protein
MSLGHLRELSVGLILFVITLLIGRELNLDLFARLVTLSVSATCAMAMFSTKFQDQARRRAAGGPQRLRPADRLRHSAGPAAGDSGA